MSVIILLEDDPWLGELYQLHLTRAGHTVILAVNSKDIVALVQRHRPALVITDLLMPEHEGMEAIFLLLRKTAAESATLPLIAISSNPVFLEMVETLVTATLLKPFPGETLVDLVQQVLHQQAPAQAAP